MVSKLYGGYNYIDLKYKPKQDFIVLFWIKGTKPLDMLAEAIAAESSVGTFTKIKTMNKRVFTHYRARVFRIDFITKTSGFVYLAYPLEHFENGNLLQFQASVLGNIYGMKEINELYVLDIVFPNKYKRLFKGPLGIKAIRKYIGTLKSRRMHVGTIVKPKVGLTPKEFSNVAYEAYIGGLDLVKDDENLVNQSFCPWKKRFDKVFDKLDKAERKTGEHKLYATNITSLDINQMFDRIDYVSERGAKMIMLDVFISGFAVVKTIVDYAHKKRLFVHAHRAGYAALDRGNYGFSFGILTKIYRMIGVDQLHVGTGVGKMEGSPLLISYYKNVCLSHTLKEDSVLMKLKDSFPISIKSIFPVASGGLHPGLLEGVHEIFDNDVIVQAGGGVHGHPKGTRAGAKAMRDAVEGLSQHKSLKEVAKHSKELKEALSHFGYLSGKVIEEQIKLVKKAKPMLERLVQSGGYPMLKDINDNLMYSIERYK